LNADQTLERPGSLTYESFDPSPTDEKGVQVGTENNRERARAEGERVITLLETVFPNLPSGMHWATTFVQHDLGAYLELRLHYDENDRAHNRAVTWVEANFPATWNATPSPLPAGCFVAHPTLELPPPPEDQ
jgi:hypothetical protein